MTAADLRHQTLVRGALRGFGRQSFRFVAARLIAAVQLVLRAWALGYPLIHHTTSLLL